MAQTQTSSTSILLRLPNELLHEIASRLATTELRIFSQVNRELHSFVIDYLPRYRHNTSICRLSNDVLCNILAQLDNKEDRSRLAQVSQKLYSTVMSFIISCDIEHFDSSMLNHAAENNLGHIARKIIRLGGNIDTHCNTSDTPMTLRLDADDPNSYVIYTPLMNAAAFEHKDMMRLLLDAGAGQVADGFQHALIVAMIWKSKSSIITLAHKITPEDMRNVLSSTRGVDFLASYRHLLQHGPDNDFVRQVRSAALYDVLSQAARDDDFVKRELDEDDYQFSGILLEFGADPDFCMLAHSDLNMRQVTTRQFAARHSDPRIRNLFLRAKKSTGTRRGRRASGVKLSEVRDESESEVEVLTPKHPNHDFWARKPASVKLPRR